MKNKILILLIAALTISVTACTKQPSSTADTLSDTGTVSSETASATDTSESQLSDIESSEPTESPASETVSPTEEKKDESKTAASSETSKPQHTANNTTTKPADTQKPAESSKPAETQKPQDSGKPTESSKPTEPPKPAEPSKPTEPPKPAFDVSIYVAYAKQYGQSIGLQYDTTIGDGAWNAPVNLYASLTDENMKKGVRSSCDRLKREGFEYFDLFAEKQGDGSYKLYIYYS